MSIENIDDIEAKYELYEPRTEIGQESSWNGRSVAYEVSSSFGAKYCLVSYKKTREKEIKHLQKDMPKKNQDGQEYYTRKARIEQLKFEIRLRESEEDFARLHWFDSSKNYSAAHNHLKRRTEAESKANQIWLERIKRGENPSPLDIAFVNSGKRQYQHNPPKGSFEINPAPKGDGAQVGYGFKF